MQTDMAPETTGEASLPARILAFPPVLLALMYYGLTYSYLAGFFHRTVFAKTPGATMQGLVSISIWAGLLLCPCCVLTQRLWLGIGLHVAWNSTQGGDYSGIVSRWKLGD